MLLYTYQLKRLQVLVSNKEFGLSKLIHHKEHEVHEGKSKDKRDIFL